MNKSSIGLLTTGFLTLVAAGCASCSLWAAAADSAAVRMVATAPLRFEPAGSGFVTRGLKFSSSLHADHMDLRTREQAMRVTFAHASAAARLEAGQPMGSASNVIHGNDRSQWRTVANYRNLHASDLYPGIDLVYYGNRGDLEYDLVVKPGADPKKIKLQISGVTPTLDAEGNLSAAFIQKRPIAYQTAADGTRTLVASRYRRNSDGSFSFALGRYDKSRELVIDPTLTFSLYLAGSSQDTAKAIGHDAKGMIYIAGITLSTDFEIDPNTTQVPGGPQYANNGGGYDLFIVQVNPTVNDGVTNPVAFATYLGGTGDDILNDMYVAPGGLVYLTGYTKSTDFPSGTITGYSSSLTGNTDAFVVIYDVTQPVGSQLVYSSYLGGGTGAAGNGVTADSKGRVYIVGTTNSSEIPVRNGLPAGLTGNSDAFVAGFDPSKVGDASLFYSTFLGGSSVEQGYGITTAADDSLWVVGQTYSQDFPTTQNAFSFGSFGGADAFLTHLDPAQPGALVYSTYLGGSGLDSAQRVAVDAKGRLIVTGLTFSGDFPVTADAAQAANAGMGDAFIAVLNPASTGPQMVYATYFGGSGAELATGLTKDAKGAIYVTGYTGSLNLPVSANAISNTQSGGEDGFVIKLDPTISGRNGLVYASYVASVGSQASYGVDVDAKGTVYVTGFTTAGIFDAISGSAKGTASGNTDAFLMGFTPQ